jgi:predicted TIM-barrel fold metal-dependent hydrolase
MMIIALEEHYFDRDWNNALDPSQHRPRPSNPFFKRMENLGAERIREMDEAGIDLQVISHGPPGSQGLREDVAVAWTKAANDRLHRSVQNYPTRFAGFASLPTTHPEAAADELERTVKKLGFKGGILHSLPEGPFLDHRRYWPIFERAAALDVPLYIHPADPNPGVVAAYYGEYATTHPSFIRPAWGFTFEAGTQAMRLVLSGLFDAYPGVKLILGHLGETIPYLLSRIDESLSRDTPMKNFREVFTSHFYVTTSGFFSDPALRCCIEEMGIDRVMFSVDWPFVSNKAGVDWLQNNYLNTDDKEKIFSGNARNLLRI